MKDSAPTFIWCVPSNPDLTWFVQAKTRTDANLLYLKILLEGRACPPAYRIVCQYKIEQYDDWAPLSYAIN